MTNDNLDLGPIGCRIIDRPVVKKTSVAYITGPIEEADMYLDLIHLLRYGQDVDAVLLHINSPGGLVSTGLQLMNAFHATKIPLVAVVDSDIASMASILSVASPYATVSEYCSMMFHDFSTVEVGKGNEIQSSINFHKIQFEKLLTKSCTGFLTKSEISAILKGADLHLNADEIIKRFKRCKKLVEVTM